MICKKCGIDGNFKWDNDWFDNTGKWRLFDTNLERPHECSRPKKPKKIKKKKIVCPKCDPQTRKPMEADKLQDHIKNEHIDWI